MPVPIQGAGCITVATKVPAGASAHGASPVALMPGDVTVDATSPSGATVDYTTATVTDLVDPSPAVACTPASGSLFAVGTTTVTCTATDTAGNTSAPLSFSVTVLSAAEQVDSLLTLVGDLELPRPRLSTSLQRTLMVALNPDASTASACRALDVFIRQVERRPWLYDDATSSQLIADAEAAKRAMGCN